MNTLGTVRTRRYLAGGDVVVQWTLDDTRTLHPLALTVEPVQTGWWVRQLAHGCGAERIYYKAVEQLLRDVADDPQLADHAVQAYATIGEPFLLGRPEPVEQVPTGAGRPLRYGEDHLRKVVRDYRRLLAVGHPTPVDFLAERCHVTRGTVGGWLRTARRRGWLAEDERVQR